MAALRRNAHTQDILPAETAGTEITRFNALKHGVLSRYTVLPWEDADEYRVLASSLADEHRPQGPTEEHLVEELAGSEGVEIEMREVYSTPFVFLTDTFTGKSLCFCDLGRGHPFRNEVSQVPSFFTSIGPSKICPHMGIDFVLYHPSS